MTRPDPSSIEAAKARYEAERAKRLRDEGLAQYQTLSEHHLDRDPWADPDFARDPIIEEVDVVVLGGGWAGMLTGINLVKRGITSFRIIDKAADFGGTWYWNRYPGCMCDVDATIYLPLLEETGYMPTEKYASATEIFGYCQLLGRHFGLYEHALFQTEVESLTWDDDAHRWDLTTQRGDRIRTQFFVSAGGLMHKAKLPGIDGIDRFAGKAFHTTRWDYDYTGGSPTEPMDRPRRQGRRDHRHRRDVGAGRAAAGPVGQGGLRLPAHAVGRRGARPAADRRGLVPLAPAGLAGRAHPQLHRGGDRPASPTATWSPTAGARRCARTPSASPPPRRSGPSSRPSTSRSWRASGDGSTRSSTIPRPPRSSSPGTASTASASASTTSTSQSFNEPNVHLVDTDGRGVREMSAGRADRGRHRVPARPAGVRVGVRDHDRPRRPPRVRPGRPRRRAA